MGCNQGETEKVVLCSDGTDSRITRFVVYSIRNSVRDCRPPDLQDLRDSGSIEQDADIVLIIERIKTGGVNLWLRKNRHGYGGEVCLHLDHDTNYSNFRTREE